MYVRLKWARVPELGICVCVCVCICVFVCEEWESEIGGLVSNSNTYLTTDKGKNYTRCDLVCFCSSHHIICNNVYVYESVCVRVCVRVLSQTIFSFPSHLLPISLRDLEWGNVTAVYHQPHETSCWPTTCKHTHTFSLTHTNTHTFSLTHTHKHSLISLVLLTLSQVHRMTTNKGPSIFLFLYFAQTQTHTHTHIENMKH